MILGYKKSKKMKITKSQKEAVINLLKEKFNEKEAAERQNFKKKNEKNIRKKYAELIDYFKKIRQLTDDLWEIRKTYDKLRCSFEELHNYRLGTDVASYFKTEEDFVNNLCDINCPKIERPDFAKVQRQLELDTLSKEFNLDDFIKKYLES